MKRICLVLTSVLFYALVHAQAPSDQTRRIDVTGSAEMDIVPDEIFFTIILEEYIPEKKDKKIEIEQLEKDLIASVAKAGIPKENLQIENVFGENWIYKNKKQKDFLQKKKYVLKLSSPEKIDQVLDPLDQKAIENVYISRYSHSKIEEYRKQLKIEAIKNAKIKATYLLQAIGDEVGKTLLVQENGFNNFYAVPLNFGYDEREITNNEYRQYQGKLDQDYVESLSVKTIKLQIFISAQFEIK